MRDTKDILKAWANGSIERRTGLEFPNRSAVILGAMRDFDRREFLTDEEMKMVDQAVLKLKKDNEEHWVVLSLFYLQNISCSKQARMLGKHTSEITKILLASECFIRGCILDFFKKG